jgi:rare lipoprotein A
VRVRNLENGRSVEVRINDRGPFVEGRVIDLSYQAAREIGLVGPGTARVEIERLDDGSEAGSRVVWAVQAGSFSDPERARALRQRLAERFDDVYVEPHAALGTTFHRVRLGPYPTRDQALSRAREVAGSGVGALVVEDVVR